MENRRGRSGAEVGKVYPGSRGDEHRLGFSDSVASFRFSISFSSDSKRLTVPASFFIFTFPCRELAVGLRPRVIAFRA
jgi:hypothetical protein